MDGRRDGDPAAGGGGRGEDLHPFDDSRIHPECYLHSLEGLLKDAGAAAARGGGASAATDEEALEMKVDAVFVCAQALTSEEDDDDEDVEALTSEEDDDDGNVEALTSEEDDDDEGVEYTPDMAFNKKCGSLFHDMT